MAAASSASPEAEKCRYSSPNLASIRRLTTRAKLRKALRQQCPEGIDVYFDNVGSDILDAALVNMARNARIVICGAMTQYNNTTQVKGPSKYLSLLVNRARMTGMVISRLCRPLSRGDKRHCRLDHRRQAQVARGYRRRFCNLSSDAPQALAGKNFGKLVLQVADV